MSGYPIYTKFGNPEINPRLFTGFLSGIDVYSHEVFSQNLQTFTLKKSKYVMVGAQKILFVARTDLKAKDEEIHKILQEMQTIFFAHFPPETYMEGWDGNTDQFSILDNLYDQFFGV
jgi:hypothetical protein